MGTDFILAKSYQDDMKTLGHGYGFYEPEKTTKVRRGMCGYIDNHGTWRHIVDLTNRVELEEKEFTSPGHLVPADGRRDIWGDVTSQGVTAKRAEFDVGGDAGEVGVEVRFVLSASRSSGAALICNEPADREGFEYEEPLRQWAKKNAATIARKFPEANTYGFYVVQSTWASEDVWINAWNGSQSEVSIGFSVRAGGVGQASPSLSYTHERSVGQWVHPVQRVDNKDVPARVVLFFKGLEFHIIGRLGNRAWLRETRGADDVERFAASDPDDPTVEYAVECFRVGKVDRYEEGDESDEEADE